MALAHYKTRECIKEAAQFAVKEGLPETAKLLRSQIKGKGNDPIATDNLIRTEAEREYGKKYDKNKPYCMRHHTANCNNKDCKDMHVKINADMILKMQHPSLGFIGPG